jgi:hypothetical protein
VLFVANEQGQAGIGRPNDLPSHRDDRVVINDCTGAHASRVHDDVPE